LHLIIATTRIALIFLESDVELVKQMSPRLKIKKKDKGQIDFEIYNEIRKPFLIFFLQLFKLYYPC
jgi:hypothetical protein